jgi:hypothetical protein
MSVVRRSLIAVLVSGFAAAGAPAFAADEPVVTANPDQPSVAAQIDDYLKTSPAIALPRDGAAGITSGGEDEPRKVHGVVDVAVGSHGYRSAYARSDIPLGKTGTLSIAVGETQGRGVYGYGGPYGYGYGGHGYGGYGSQPYRSQNLALGLAFGGAGQDANARCRDPGSRHRIDPMLTGPLGEGRGDDWRSGCDRQPAPERPLD